MFNITVVDKSFKFLGFKINHWEWTVQVSANQDRRTINSLYAMMNSFNGQRKGHARSEALAKKAAESYCDCIREALKLVEEARIQRQNGTYTY